MTKPTRIPRIPDGDSEVVYGVEYVDVINIHESWDEAIAEWEAVINDDGEHAVLIYGWRQQNGDIVWMNEVSS